MSPKKYYTFMIERAMIAAMKRAAATIPDLSEGALIRQAIREWLDRHGVSAKKKTASRRAGTRRKASKRQR